MGSWIQSALHGVQVAHERLLVGRVRLRRRVRRWIRQRRGVDFRITWDGLVPPQELRDKTSAELEKLLLDGLGRPADLFFHVVKSDLGEVIVSGGSHGDEFVATYEPGGAEWDEFELAPEALNEALVASGMTPVSRVRVPRARKKKWT